MKIENNDFNIDRLCDPNWKRDFDEVDLQCRECIRDRIRIDEGKILNVIVERELNEAQRRLLYEIAVNERSIKDVSAEMNIDYQAARRMFEKAKATISDKMKYIVEYNEMGGDKNVM